MTDQKENKQTLDEIKSSVPVSLHPSNHSSAKTDSSTKRFACNQGSAHSGEAHLFMRSVIMLGRTSAGEEKFKVIVDVGGQTPWKTCGD